MRSFELFDFVPLLETGEEFLEGNTPSTELSRRQALETVRILCVSCGKPPSGAFFALKPENTFKYRGPMTLAYFYETDKLNHREYLDSLDKNFPVHWDKKALINLKLIRRVASA